MAHAVLSFRRILVVSRAISTLAATTKFCHGTHRAPTSVATSLGRTEQGTRTLLHEWQCCFQETMREARLIWRWSISSSIDGGNPLMDNFKNLDIPVIKTEEVVSEQVSFGPGLFRQRLAPHFS